MYCGTAIILNKMFLKKINNQKGISLIELVVAVSIFSLVVITASGIFINAIKTQKVILAKQNIAENLRYASEFMVKELRMAQPVNPANLTFLKSAGVQLNSSNSPSSSIQFFNYNADFVTYSLVGNKIMRNSGTGDEPISSDEVKIIGLSFILNDWNLAVGPAPYITIIIIAESMGGTGGAMELQTGVSPRIY